MDLWKKNKNILIFYNWEVKIKIYLFMEIWFYFFYVVELKIYKIFIKM